MDTKLVTYSNAKMKNTKRGTLWLPPGSAFKFDVLQQRYIGGDNWGPATPVLHPSISERNVSWHIYRILATSLAPPSPKSLIRYWI